MADYELEMTEDEARAVVPAIIKHIKGTGPATVSPEVRDSLFAKVMRLTSEITGVDQ